MAMSTPLAIDLPVNTDNGGATQWTTVSDQIQLRYYFRNSPTPNTIWVDVPALNLNQSDSAPFKGEQAAITLVKVDGDDIVNFEEHGCVNNKFESRDDPYQV